MMLAGSLLAAIAEARACRSRWGWATTPTLAASRAKARLAWLGLTGEHQVQLDRLGRPAGFDPSQRDPHPDDPSGPASIRLDRRPLQPEQARSVWSRPDRRRAPGYGSGGWGSNPSRRAPITAAQRPCDGAADRWQLARLRPNWVHVGGQSWRLRPSTTTITGLGAIPPAQAGKKALIMEVSGDGDGARFACRCLSRAPGRRHGPPTVPSLGSPTVPPPSAAIRCRPHRHVRCAAV
jgi:hypothetical protein